MICYHMFMIYIDASRYNNTDRRTGVENYSYYLINELVRSHGDDITLIAPRSIDLNVPQIVIPFPRLWTQLRLSWYLLWNRAVCTLFVPSHVIPLITARCTITTVHDVAFKRFPDSYSRWSRWYLDWGVRRAVKKAKAIITPSQATKEDLIRFYKADDAKIQVIPLGFERMNDSTEDARLSQGFAARLPQDLAPKSYFLFIGRIETKRTWALWCALLGIFSSPSQFSVGVGW
ncbi:glycosyltransferase [Candidatus Peregrinibacteria bacterium]|nr:MAG: glycosyltransferase [Candidatus Peregrinibacteria bacterium]